MTNAPIILTLDCDMYSNDPHTPLRVLCYILDPQDRSKLGYIQFPQHFKEINKTDTYACEFKSLFQINPVGFDGLAGPNHVGTGCFFLRRVLFGGPSKLLSPEIPELGPYHVVNKPIRSQPIMELSNKVASCNYENQTKWGSEVSFICCGYLFIFFKYTIWVVSYVTVQEGIDHIHMIYQRNLIRIFCIIARINCCNCNSGNPIERKVVGLDWDFLLSSCSHFLCKIRTT
jgi:hypothetical protein